MANRRLSQFFQSYQRVPVQCAAQVTFGTTGAPTLATNSLFSAVTRNGAGDYTFTMRDKFNALLCVKHVFNSGSSAPAAPGMYIKTNSVSAASPLMRVIFNAAGTATDPASGEIVFLQFIFSNSSVNP